MKRWARCGIAWLPLLCTGLLCACAQSSILSRTIADRGDTTSAINYVALHVTDGAYQVTSGGTVSGTQEYAVSDWVSVAQVAEVGSFIEVLVPRDGTLTNVIDAGVTKPELQRHFARVFALSMQALLSFHDQPLPTIDAKIRVVPPGVRYSNLQLYKTDRLDHFAVEFVDTTAMLREDAQKWLDGEVLVVTHELLHMNRWNKASFARQLDDPENETQAYLLSSCARFIANDELPEMVFNYPITLEDFVAPEDRDVRIDEVYNSMVEQRELPTIVGFNTSFLAIHRYFVRLRELGVVHPKAQDAFALCHAVAHDQLNWADKTIDEKIYLLAQATAAKYASKPATTHPAR